MSLTKVNLDKAYTSLKVDNTSNIIDSSKLDVQSLDKAAVSSYVVETAPKTPSNLPSISVVDSNGNVLSMPTEDILRSILNSATPKTGYIEVPGLGKPMTINASVSDSLSEAFALLNTVTNGNFANNGGLVVEGKPDGSNHKTGRAYDILTTLGVRLKYNNDGTVTMAQWNSDTGRTETKLVSGYDVFYVTCDVPIEDIYNTRDFKTRAYVKIDLNTVIPPELQKYIVRNLDNVLEVDDVTKSHPDAAGMHYTKADGIFLDYTALMEDYGWEAISPVTTWTTSERTFQSLEWHHFQNTNDASGSKYHVVDENGKTLNQDELRTYINSKYLESVGDVPSLNTNSSNNQTDKPTTNNNSNANQSNNFSPSENRSSGTSSGKAVTSSGGGSGSSGSNNNNNNGTNNNNNNGSNTGKENTVSNELPSSPFEKWPPNGIAQELPGISFGTKGKILLNKNNAFSYIVNGITEKEFQNYGNLLINSGFESINKNEFASNTSHVFISYENNSMNLSIFKR